MRDTVDQKESKYGQFFPQVSRHSNPNMMLCAIWYHWSNLKNVKNTHGGVLLLVKFQTLVCNVTKSKTPRWVFFTFYKLYIMYQIAQIINITFVNH